MVAVNQRRMTDGSCSHGTRNTSPSIIKIKCTPLTSIIELDRQRFWGTKMK